MAAADTSWAVEMDPRFQRVTTPIVREVYACLVRPESLELAAWTDGTDWADLGDPVGWSDWPNVDLLIIANLEEG